LTLTIKKIKTHYN